MGTLCSPGRRPRVVGGITGAAGCRGAAPAASRGSPRAAPQHPAPRSHPGPGAAHPPAGTLPWRGPAERCWATADAAWGMARLRGAGWERGCVRSLCCAVLCPECGTVCEPQGRPRAGAGTGLGGGQSRDRARPRAGPYLEQGPALRPAPLPRSARPVAAPVPPRVSGLGARPAAPHRGTDATPRRAPTARSPARTAPGLGAAGRGGANTPAAGRAPVLIGRAAPHAPEGAGSPSGRERWRRRRCSGWRTWISTMAACSSTFCCVCGTALPAPRSPGRRWCAGTAGPSTTVRAGRRGGGRARFLRSGCGSPFGSALPGSAPLPSRIAGASGRRGTGLRGLRRARSPRRPRRRLGAA